VKGASEFLQGAEAERTVIVAWLRKNTNLRSLAKLIEDDVCSKPAGEQADYCAKQGIALKP
jgi:hypothetical protein